MLRTLNAKLIAALLVVIALLAATYLVLTISFTRLHFEEVNQKLHFALAQSLVDHSTLLPGGDVDLQAFKSVFQNLMVVNPAIELYLTDTQGRLLAFSAPEGAVKRDRIDLAPIRAFLEGSRSLPIRGTDPRDLSGNKVFSVAPISGEGDAMVGYLYVVLGGQLYDSVESMFEGSLILRIVTGIAIVGLVLAALAGVLSFRAITARLRRLTGEVDRFRRGAFAERLPAGHWRAGPGADEIDQLGLTFEEMSARITEQIQKLHDSDQSRRELIANVSHDLRTPLASLQGYLETLLMKQDALDRDEKEKYLRLALNHSSRLGRLIKELFELATLDNTDSAPAFEPFSLAELAQDVTQKFALQAEQKSLVLETDIPHDAPFVSGDIGLIERVLENLIENAIKYTPDGGRVRIALTPHGEALTAEIADTGVGIPEADLPRIFDRFYRVESHRPDDVEGTGLGLAIARRILQLHGVTIDVKSRLGEGTRFTFDLPLARA
jgi:two-component system OmpR family sensor kinase